MFRCMARLSVNISQFPHLWHVIHCLFLLETCKKVMLFLQLFYMLYPTFTIHKATVFLQKTVCLLPFLFLCTFLMNLHMRAKQMKWLFGAWYCGFSIIWKKEERWLVPSYLCLLLYFYTKNKCLCFAFVAGVAILCIFGHIFDPIAVANVLLLLWVSPLGSICLSAYFPTSLALLIQLFIYGVRVHKESWGRPRLFLFLFCLLCDNFCCLSCHIFQVSVYVYTLCVLAYGLFQLIAAKGQAPRAKFHKNLPSNLWVLTHPVPGYRLAIKALLTKELKWAGSGSQTFFCPETCESYGLHQPFLAT